MVFAISEDFNHGGYAMAVPCIQPTLYGFENSFLRGLEYTHCQPVSMMIEYPRISA